VRRDRAEATVTLVLHPSILSAARAAASACALDLGRWTAQVVEAHVADLRCRHGLAHDPVRDVPGPEHAVRGLDVVDDEADDDA
jgi:hypothetical protein